MTSLRSYSYSVLLVMFASLTATAFGADWPTYLHDNSRSGIAGESLSVPLQQQWVFTPCTTPAAGWGLSEQGNLYHCGIPFIQLVRYDDCYHVAAVGNYVYFCASGECRVYCIDATSGMIVWAVPMTAPSRCGPTVDSSKVYVTCDDGNVYCLNAADGSQVWKYTAATLTDRISSQGYIISECPARTGVVIDSGNAIFTGGLYPNFGINLVAVNAATGAQVWKNSTVGTTYTNFAPQGYMLASSDSLIIPAGRITPVVFNKSTGAGRYAFPAGPSGPQGGTYIMLNGSTVIGGSNALSGYPFSTSAASQSWSWARGREVVISSANVVYMVTDTDIFAIPLSAIASAAGNTSGNYTDPPTWTTCTWRKTGENVPSSLVLSGSLLFAGGVNKVNAYSITDGSKQWTATVDGDARGLAVANGRLIVSTTTGKVYSFGASGNGTTVAPPSSTTPYAPDSYSSFYSTTAASIVQAAGLNASSQGYCVILGGEKGRLAYELAKLTSLKFYVLETNAANVAAAKTALYNAGYWGNRIVEDQVASLSATGYPPYQATLLIDEEGFFGGSITTTSAEFTRLLRPCGGVGFIGQPAGGAALGTTLASSAVTSLTYQLGASCVATQSGSWAQVSKGKLPGAGEWTHGDADAGNTCGTNDTLIQPTVNAPKLLWFGDPGPAYMIDRHARSTPPLVVNGRFFIQGNNVVMGYDAYTGRQLWQRTISGANRDNNPNYPSPLASADDTSIYLAVNNVCYRLDAVTGNTLQTYTAPSGGANKWAWAALDKASNTLFGSRANVNNYDTSDLVFAMDITTGALKWSYSGTNMPSLGMAMGDGKVFILNRNTTQAQKDQATSERIAEVGNYVDYLGATITPDPALVTALNASSGAVVWTHPRDIIDCHVDPYGGDPCLIYKNQILLVAGAPCHQSHELATFDPAGNGSDNGGFVRRTIGAFNTTNGTKIWGGPKNYQTRPILAGTTIYAEPWFYDLATGVQLKNKAGTANWQFFRGYSGNCGGSSATPYEILTEGGGGGVAYYDLAAQTGMVAMNKAQRSGCWIDLIGACGLMVAPECSSQCTCGVAIQDSLVFYAPNVDGPPPNTITCQLFYNNSRFDGNNAAANASDDAAIATDKTPLRSGGTASFANYTSYAKGINGIMIDILPAMPGTPVASDFAIKKGNSNTPSSWTTVAMKSSYITVRRGAGINGADRVVLTFPDGLIYNTWIQLTVKASTNTGVTSDYVYYFGNAIGETGNSATSASVTTADLTATQQDVHKTFANPATIIDPCDFNRDGKADSADQVIVRSNYTTIVNELKLITVP